VISHARVPRARLAGALLAALCLVPGAAAHAQEPAPIQSPAGAPEIAPEAPEAPEVPDPQAKRLPFAEWLTGVRAEAVKSGIREATVDAAFAGLEPLPIVVERDRTQAEFTLSLEQYVDRRLTRKIVRDTAAAARTHRSLLARVAAKYQVPAHVVVAVWALESNLGRFAGVRPTITTLATLAWDGRRAAFFRAQLLDALRILDRGDIEPERLKGSWAGAMGQVQFMPSSYLQYAVDFDGNGQRDIWTSPADVFGSIANYLREHGWKDAHGWGRQVSLPRDRAALEAAAPPRASGCRAERETTVPLPVERWRELGVRTASGGVLPGKGFEAWLLVSGERSFLLHPDYEALLRYNCAHAYALAVGLLSDRVSGKAVAPLKKDAARKTPAKKAKKTPAKKPGKRTRP
jgi:membrane-bound lytic murein transglycosylase B